VQTVHLIGIALLFGSIAVVDLRLLGFSRALSLPGLERHALPWTGLAFALAALSGGLLFSAHAVVYLGKPVFGIKLALIVIAGGNALAFHWLSKRVGDHPVQDAQRRRTARIAGASSLGLWGSVITCGRLLAYL